MNTLRRIHRTPIRLFLVFLTPNNASPEIDVFSVYVARTAERDSVTLLLLITDFPVV